MTLSLKTLGAPFEVRGQRAAYFESGRRASGVVGHSGTPRCSGHDAFAAMEPLYRMGQIH